MERMNGWSRKITWTNELQMKRFVYMGGLIGFRYFQFSWLSRYVRELRGLSTLLPSFMSGRWQ